MSYRQKKQRRNNAFLQNQICPTIGLLNQSTTLKCELNPQIQTHKFICSFTHPLQFITSLFEKRKKQAFEKILFFSDFYRIQLQNLFLPKQLLCGNQTIMSAFKNQLQRTKINSYIKLNITSSKVEFNKRSNSCQLTTSALNSKASKIQPKSLQKRYPQNIDSNITINKKQQHFTKNQQKQNTLNFLNVKQTNIQNYYSSKTIVSNKQKSKSKSKPLNINVSYTIIQSSVDNPESSSIYDKAFTSKDNVYKDKKNKSDLYEQNLKIPLTSHFQNGKVPGHMVATYHDQILSQRMNRSVKNSQVSELTHHQNQVFHYSKERKYAKKDKRVFQVQDN